MLTRLFGALLSLHLFLVPALAGISAAPTPIVPPEPIGEVLRRLADAAADGKNSVERPPIYGAIAYPSVLKGTSAPADTTALTIGWVYHFSSHWYRVGIAGTTGTGTRPSTCPANTDISSDGSVRWLCDDTLWQVGAMQAGVALPDGSHNVFKIRQAGDPQTTSSVSITGITCATATGIATVTTAAHGMLGMSAVTIAGETPSSYNGTWRAQVASSTTYTLPDLACTANDSVHGTSVNAGPGADCAGPINDGTIIWQCMGKLAGPTVIENASHDGTLTNIFPVAPSTQTTPFLLPANPTTGSVFRYEGGIPAVSSVNGSDYMVSILGPEMGNSSATNCWSASQPLGIEPQCNYEAWSFNAEVSGKMEIKGSGNTLPLNIIVDGQNLTPDPIKQAYNGAANYIVLDFTGLNPPGISKTHNIKIESGQAMRMISVNVQPTDSLSPIQVPTDIGVAFFGTSLTAGTNASGEPWGWTNVFRYLLGLPNNLNYGEGGTGYSNPGTTVVFSGHAATDLSRFVTNAGTPIGLIVIEGGQNDSGATYSNATIATAASSLVTSLHAAYPYALIVGMDSPYGHANSPPAVGTCVPSSGTTITLTATNGGAFVATSGSSAAGNLVGTRYINIGGHSFTVSSAASGTVLTVSSSTSTDGLLTLTNATTYACFSPNPYANLAATEEAIQASYTAIGSPYVQYIQTVGGQPTLSGLEMQGTGNQSSGDGTCYLAGTGSTAGNAYYDVSNNGGHPNNCGYSKIGRLRAALFRQLLFSKNANGTFVIP